MPHEENSSRRSWKHLRLSNAHRRREASVRSATLAPATEQCPAAVLDFLALTQRLAVVAAVTLVTIHWANGFLLGRPRVLLDANAEGSVWTWASVLATGTAAFGALLAASTRASRRVELYFLSGICAFLSLDDMIALHERIAVLICHIVGISETWDSVVWPILYGPLLLIAVLMFFRMARARPKPVQRPIAAGLAALGVAIVLEFASAPWSVGANAVHILEGGVEEALELGGWMLIASGVVAAALTDLIR